jgi:transcriptional regulator with GAF, ATPase, and Fis domain
MVCNEVAAGLRDLANAAGEEQAHEFHLGPHRVVLADAAMLNAYELIGRLARGTLPILIQGETGAGKELAAAAAHALSRRSEQPFVSINCAAIPETLAESELFGHERGAFSGAVAARPGPMELAHTGTVFLDEIGELSLAIQAKLLRVVETHEVQRLGDITRRPVDIRIVAATNRDLRSEIERGRFRRDLYFRIGVAQVSIPALRACPRGLRLLPPRLLADACKRLGRPPLRLSHAATELVLQYPWPGNVRELKHAMDYAAAAAPDLSAEVDVMALPAALFRTDCGGTANNVPVRESRVPDESPFGDVHGSSDPARSFNQFRPIDDEIRELERMRMIEALAVVNGIKTKAAELIGMPLRTFVTKLKRYAITTEWKAL